MQLSDQEAEHSADGDHEHLVILEHGSKDGFVLVRGQFAHLLDDEVLDVEGLCGEVYAQHLAAGTPTAPRTVTPAETRETLACS